MDKCMHYALDFKEKGIHSMANAVSNVSFRCDAELKAKAESLFSELGLSMSSALVLFLTQSVREGGLPFKPTTRVPNTETLAALEELERMMKTRPEGYSVEEALEELKA